MNEITEEIQQELDNIYELICTGDLNNIELAYELSKNYKFDINNWSQFFVRKSKSGILYNDVTNKLDSFRNLGSNYKDDYFTNDKALKFYKENSKLAYSKNSYNVVKIDHVISSINVRISINTSDQVIIGLQRWGNNKSINSIGELENYGNDIVMMTTELKQRNLFQEWFNDNNQHNFYTELEKFIRLLYINIASDWFQNELIQNKIIYDWNSKTSTTLVYKHGVSRIELINLHSNNTKFSLYYYRGTNYSPKITKSRRIDLLVKDYKKYITN